MLSNFQIIIAVAVMVFLLLVLTAFVLSLYKALQRLQQLQDAQQGSINDIKKRLGEVNNGSMWLFERMVALEKQLENQIDVQQLDETTNAGQTEVNDNFNKAAQLIDSGLSSSQLAERLGVSESEAKLMLLMHRARS